MECILMAGRRLDRRHGPDHMPLAVA